MTAEARKFPPPGHQGAWPTDQIVAAAKAGLPLNRDRIGKWADFVYLRRGGVTHILPFGAHTDVITYPTSLCGRSPSWSCSWLGTGSQDEIDQARRMPLCIRCLDLATEVSP